MKNKRINKQHTQETRVLSSSRSSMTMIWIPAFFVALVTLLVYLPALNNGFVNWDDQAYVYENQNVQSFDLGFLKWSLTAVVASLWHPLTLISLALDHAIWGLNPWGYHLTNILIHSLNTFLVFMLAMRLIECNNLWKDKKKALVSAFTAALLFGIHPLHVESVAWVSERKDVLSAFFFLLTLLTYIKYVRANGSNRMYFYSLSLISFILALMSKPMVVTLPIVLLILDYYPFKRLELKNAKTMLLEKLPFFSLSFLTALATLWAHKTSGALPTLEIFPLTTRSLSAMYAYIFYLAKMIMPVGLAPFYPYPEWMDLFTIKYITAYILLILITISAIWSMRGHRLFSTVWLFYFIMLIPVIGIVQVGEQAAADRYTYLPSLGPFILAGISSGYLFELCPQRKARIGFIMVLTFTLSILTVKAIKQIDIWQDPIALWSHEIKLSPKAATAYINRGKAYADAWNHQLALRDYGMAIQLNPLRFEAHLNRGVAFYKLGKYQEALTDVNRSLTLNPKSSKSFNTLGSIYSDLNDSAQAITSYNEAIKIDPQFAEAYYNLGNVYYSAGNYQMAITDYNKAIELRPKYADAYANLGVALDSIGNYDQAIKNYNKAIALQPNNAMAYYNLGLLYFEVGKWEEAFINYKKAAALGLKEAQELIR